MLATLRSIRQTCVPLRSISASIMGQHRAIASSSRLSTIDQLQAAFRDKSSPFYLEPGTQGPSSPGEGYIIPEEVYTLSGTREEHTFAASSIEELTEVEGSPTPQKEGMSKLSEMGFDPESFYNQTVVWGDQDSFRHVNNVRYLRYLESARIHWMQSLARELGGDQKAHDMISGKGVSLILADVSIKFRRPITYPDTLLVAHRPHDPFPTHFNCAAAIWSNAQRAIVATSESKLVWYDYDRLKKCDPGAEAHSVLAKRIRA